MVLFHNENEVWKPVKPEIEAGDASADGRAIRLMVATAAEMGLRYAGQVDESAPPGEE